MAATRSVPLLLLPVVAAFTALLVGLLAGLAPALAIAGVAGMVFTAFVFANLTFGLCLFTTVSFLEALPGLGVVSYPKIIGLLLVLSWIGGMAIHQHVVDDRVRMQPLLVAAMLLLFTWTATSALWASDSLAALDSAQRWGLNLLLFPIAYAAVRSTKDLESLYIAFIVGTALSILLGALGVFGEDPGGDEGGAAGRLGGSGINANQLGGLLVCATVFAAALAVSTTRSFTTRTIWLIVSILAAAALAATLSRGALLGMAVTLLVAPFFAGARRQLPAAILSLILAGSIGLGIVALAPDTAVKRITQSDQTGSGRTDIWRVGWRMVEDRPMTGVGAGNFERTTVKYLLQPGVITEDELIVDTPKVAHNIYLQVLAELGIVGLVLFLVIIGFCLDALRRAANNLAQAGDRSGEMLVRALTVALIGLLAAYFFSSQLYSKPMWLMLAVSPAVLALSIRAKQAARP